MSLLTIAQLREHVQTDLVDDAVQRLIDDAEAEIDKRIGELTTQTDTFRGETLATVLFLSRRADAMSTITEEVASGDGYTETALDPADYKLRYDGRQIERLSTGPNPRSTWGDVVTTVYVPADDTARRLRVTIDLVRLAVSYNALDSESIGDYSSRTLRYDTERTRLLASLKSWRWA